MRVLERIVEADRARIVARPLDVAAEVALPCRRQEPLADGVGEADEKALILPAGVEHFPFRAVVVLGVAHVRLDEHAALCEALRHLERPAALRHARADGAGDPCPQRTVRLRATRADRDDAAERIGAVGDRPRTARHVDAFDDRGIEERGARAHAALGGDAAAIDQEQRAAAREPADRRHRRVPFGDLVDAGHGLERLHQILGTSLRDLRTGQNRSRRGGGGIDAGRRAEHGHRLVCQCRNADCRRPLLKRINGHRPNDLPAREHDDHLERHRWHGRPREPSIRIRPSRAGDARRWRWTPPQAEPRCPQGRGGPRNDRASGQPRPARTPPAATHSTTALNPSGLPTPALE